MFQMKLAIFALLLLSGCSLLCAGPLDGGDKLEKVEEAIPATPTASTVAPPIPTSSSTTSTTPAPTTNKPTTPATTTTTTATTTTTTVPPETTTVEPKTTTTPAPAPYPEPSIGSWNSSCIMIKMATQLNFTYETKDNKTARTLYNVPADAVVDDAHCDIENTQFIQINWGPSQAQHTMLLQFDKVNNTAQLSMIRFILPLMSDRFPNAKDNQTLQFIHRGSEFGVPLKMSYHCTRAQTFNMVDTVQTKNVKGTVTMRNVQVEAFRNANNTAGFSTARDCDSSGTVDAVPIAVGIALVALILIVLISYLYGRQRALSHGYMSF